MKPLRAFERAIVFLMERYRPVHLRRFKIAIGLITVLVAAAVLMLGWLSMKKTKEVVAEEFNKQQLVLAQHAARQIENSLDLLRSELSILSQSASLRLGEDRSIAHRLQITFDRIAQKGAREVRYVEAEGGRTHLYDARGYRIVPADGGDREILHWARPRDNRNKILLNDALPLDRGDDQGRFLAMATPVWTGPAAPADTAGGALIFVVDATTLVSRIAQGIRSGKSGYAWVINDRGIFLYHPEREFIAKDAFAARREKRPFMSFARINEIQKHKMLKGEEGTSWYFSGWHEGKEGEIRKLIAYAPIHLHADAGSHTWSVAVVAPIDEVESAVHGIQVRQLMLQGVVLLSIFSGGLLLVGIMLKWSSVLTMEVERKTRELRSSESHYRLLVDNANDIIFTVRRDYVITSMNKAGYQFFSRGAEEILGRDIGEICFNESSAALQYRAIDEVFATGENRQLVYSLVIHGAERWVSASFSPVKEDDGSSAGVLGILRDITETKRKEQEEQMHHTEKLASMGTLAAGVAHEINNPLGIILGFTDLLLEKAAPGTPEHDMLSTIERHGLNAKRVVENLLSFARYSDHREETMDLNASVEAVLAVVKNTLLLNRITLTTHLQDNLPTARGDPREMQQVFLNIINNAIYAMKGGGTLTVRSGLDNGGVEVRFSDTGPGIPKEHRGRIFDPLFTTKKVGEGTGLGLSVSYGLVTKHGGTITFETATQDESSSPGTTFIVRLQAAGES